MRHSSCRVLVLLAALPGSAGYGRAVPHPRPRSCCCTPQRSSCAPRRSSALRLNADDQPPQLPAAEPASPAERERMLDALLDGAPGISKTAESRAIEPTTEMPSHMTLARDDTGEPELARFTYVDESTCIGCKNCAFVARNTFFMEDDLGRARVYNQGGDNDDLIDEAIDSCPVNCIHYVSHEDLITLELERISRDDNLDFNNYASFKKAWTGQDAAVPETKATYYGSLAQGNRCNNCPSRGCASCPMFGVGMNPIYLQRQRQRQERKIQSGQAAREAADAERQRRIDILFGDDAAGGGVGAPPPLDGSGLDEGVDEGVLQAIFGEGYSMGDEPAAALASSSAEAAAEEEAKQKLREVLDAGAADGLDPYDVLGVPRDASPAEIKRAFRRLALRWHPDRCTTLPAIEQLQAELIFKQINLAHQVLTDEAKRRQYDAGTSLRELVVGVWEQLARRMQGKQGKGVVVATGSGLALEELAADEERDSGIKAPLLLSAIEDTAGSVKPVEQESQPADPEPMAADGTRRKPGVKYDAWGRPMA